MHVLLLSRYGRRGASSRVRCYQYLPYLEKNGVITSVSPLLGDNYLSLSYSGQRIQIRQIFRPCLKRVRHLLGSRRFDLVWAQKEVFPWLPAWGEAFLNQMQVPFVVDYDDAVFHNYDLHAISAVRTLLGRKVRDAMRRSTMVIAGNEYIAQYALKSGARRVEVIPTVIDLDRYHTKKCYTDDSFTIGWIGSPVTSTYLSTMHSMLHEVCSEGRARVVLVGAGRMNMEGVPVEIRAWSEKTEVSDIQTFDVGIMPLPDTPWERGKCGYKLIQYMACGIPVIASPVGVNTSIVQNGENGFLAKTREDWVDALRTLIADKQLCRRMGVLGRKKVENEYSLRVTEPRLLSLLCRAASGAD